MILRNLCLFKISLEKVQKGDQWKLEVLRQTVRPFVPIQNVSLFRDMMKHASIHKYDPLCNVKMSIFLSHCARDT